MAASDASTSTPHAAPSPADVTSILDCPVRQPTSVTRDVKIHEAGTSPQDEDTPLLEEPEVPQDQADEVRTYLRALTAGRCSGFDQPRDYHVPLSSWFGLSSDIDSCREKFRFKIAYDASDSLLTIYPMAGAIHRTVQKWLFKRAAVEEELNFDLPAKREITLQYEDEFLEFEGEWEHSVKVPDFGSGWFHGANMIQLHTAFEVGVSQSTESLLRAKDLYLEGSTEVSQVVLVDIIETPRYQRPENLDIDELRDIDRSRFEHDPEQGTVWYKGVQWVGRVSISWQVWNRDKPTEPVFQATLHPNDTETHLPFFDIPASIGSSVKAVTIKPADIRDLWETLLTNAAYQQAYVRMKKYVKDVTECRKQPA